MFPQDPNTKEYLQLALNKVLELQREIKDGTYVAETNNDSDDLGNIKFLLYFTSGTLHKLEH